MLTTIIALLASAVGAFGLAPPPAGAAAAVVVKGEPESAPYDIVIYGGTSAGVAAGVQARRMGKTVVVIEPSPHLGGLSSSGLGWTDSGNKAVIGGISREFYQRIKRHYDDPASWRFDTPDTYRFYRAGDDAMWTFEPHVAERTFREMCREAGVEVVYGERLDRTPVADGPRVRGVEMRDGAMTRIVMESGNAFAARVFIDATYEGDLMAGAGVRYAVGREPNTAYGEAINGVQRALNTKSHRFMVDVDPYIAPGDPESGLLHGIDPGPYPADGQGDHRVQAYCYRMCLSKDPDNRVPFPKPASYDESLYELLFRNFEAGDLRLPLKMDMMPNGKTDTNNQGAVSTDYIGQNYAYPDASYAERERIEEQHRTYQMGLMWTLQTHARVPAEIRDRMAEWGLPKNEFEGTGHWPHQIYVREARRMIGAYVMTEHDCRRTRVTPASVGMGSYNMDSHNCMRWVTDDGTVQNEGDVQLSPGGPYMISYLSLVPKREEASNLLVPVCVSSSHAAYGSIRMEPVFMILGQSAATAASIAIDRGLGVQDVDYAELRARLLGDGQVLEATPDGGPSSRPGLDPGTVPGVVIDDDNAELIGDWVTSTSVGGYVARGYRHDDGTRGAKRAIYRATLAEAGAYHVRVSYAPHPNRGSNVPITITSEGRVLLETRIDQRQTPPIDGVWLPIAQLELPAGPVSVTISNAGTDGYVIADAVQFERAVEEPRR